MDAPRLTQEHWREGGSGQDGVETRTGQEPLSSGEAGPTRLPGSSLGSLGVDRRVCLDVGETYGRRGRDRRLPTQHLLPALPYHQTLPH